DPFAQRPAPRGTGVPDPARGPRRGSPRPPEGARRSRRRATQPRYSLPLRGPLPGPRRRPPGPRHGRAWRPLRSRAGRRAAGAGRGLGAPRRGHGVLRDPRDERAARLGRAGRRGRRRGRNARRGDGVRAFPRGRAPRPVPRHVGPAGALPEGGGGAPHRARRGGASLRGGGPDPVRRLRPGGARRDRRLGRGSSRRRHPVPRAGAHPRRALPAGQDDGRRTPRPQRRAEKVRRGALGRKPRPLLPGARRPLRV
ncbi:MAG: ParB-like nuclease, partial [uncultured Rubrobacteraceae bacterium]